MKNEKSFIEYCGLYAQKSALAYILVMLGYQLIKIISAQNPWALPALFTAIMMLHFYFLTKVSNEINAKSNQQEITD